MVVFGFIILLLIYYDVVRLIIFYIGVHELSRFVLGHHNVIRIYHDISQLIFYMHFIFVKKHDEFISCFQFV